MKHLYLSLFFFISGYAMVSAQNAADYNFNVQSGVPLEDISSGSTLIFGNRQDDISSAPITLPFTFNFAGTDYNQFSVSSNGLIGLGPVSVTANGEDNLIDQSETYPLLAPWWEDLYTAANGSISYKTIGIAGTRKLVVEWKVRKYKANGNLLYDKTFQAWLFEGTNKIQYVYGNGVVDAFTTASIGIANSGTDYLVVNSTDNTTSSTSADNTDAWPGNGTSYVFSPFASVAQPITIGANGTVQGVSCNGGNNGVIALGAISGGDGNYTISWTGPGSYTATGASISGLSAGTYHYSITDGTGSTPATGDLTVTEPAPVTVSTATTNVSCNGTADGSIVVTNSEGSTVVITDANGADVTAANGHYGAGIYTVTASSAGGCTAAQTVTISEPAVVTVNATSANVSCYGAANGSIAVHNSEGSIVTITDANGANVTANNGHYSAGVYTITAAHAGENGNVCSATQTVTITEPSVLAATVQNVTNVTCSDATNGSVTISATGGTSPYTYTLQSVTNTTGVFSGLAGGGSYNVTVTDAHGCSTAVAATITRPAALTATVTPVNGTCSGTNNGKITISNATGGNGTYQFHLNAGAWQSGGSFTGLANGTYSVQMRDASNTACVKDLGNVTITKSGTLPAVSISTGVPGFCANLTLTATATGASSYSWSNGATGNSINLGIADNDGNYSVTVSNASGCTASASFAYAKQNQLSSYTLVGLKAIALGENNTVNGAVGTIAQDLLVYINKNSTINGFVKSPAIVMTQPVTVTGGLIYASANVTLPAMFYNSSNTNSLSNLTIPDDYNGAAITGNYKQLTIGKRARVTIKGNVFGKITVKEAADATFTAADISIDEIQTDNGKTQSGNVDYTTMTFQPNTIIRIKNKVGLGEKNRLYATGSTLYMGDMNPDAEKITITGKNTIVNVNVYMPHGLMAVKGGDAANTCTMNGMFIAEGIASDKYVNWNGYNCNAATQTSSSASGRIMGAQAETETTVTSVEATEIAVPVSKAIKTGVYPNPTNGQFTLQLNNAKATTAEIIIVNQNGAEVMHQREISLESYQALQLNLTQHAAGMYMVKVITSEGVKIFKMVVQK